MLKAAAITPDNVSNTIYEYLETRFPSLSPIAGDAPLLEGAIDSLGFLELIMFLSERFDISIDDENFEFENLSTPENIVTFVRQMMS